MRVLIILLLVTFLGIVGQSTMTCDYTVCPSGDVTGGVDRDALQAAVDMGGIITIAPGDYYFTKVPGQIGLINITTDTVTIDGGDWNHTIMHMVGVENAPNADWYLFRLVSRDGFTLRNLTINGEMLQTVAEQTHGMVIQESSNIIVENVRGQYIYGDTAKILYTCNNCQFLNTEHLSNGRSGIAMRGQPPGSQSLTYGGITIDRLLCIDVSDQCIDMETGITPGEMILSNGRVYGENNNSICMAIVGELDASGQPGMRVVMDNWQVYCKTYLFNAGDVIISNSIFHADNLAQSGTALLIQKTSGRVIVSDSLIVSDGAGNGAVHITSHNDGRPKHISLNGIIIDIRNTVPGGTAVQIYNPGGDISLDNVEIININRLDYGVNYTNMTGGLDLGYLAISGLKINNSTWGVKIGSGAPAGSVSVIDTLTVHNSHFRNITYGIDLRNPAYHSTPYVRDYDFGGNVFGEGVGTPIIIGSVFSSP